MADWNEAYDYQDSGYYTPPQTEHWNNQSSDKDESSDDENKPIINFSKASLFVSVKKSFEKPSMCSELNDGSRETTNETENYGKPLIYYDFQDFQFWNSLDPNNPKPHIPNTFSPSHDTSMNDNDTSQSMNDNDTFQSLNENENDSLQLPSFTSFDDIERKLVNEYNLNQPSKRFSLFSAQTDSYSPPSFSVDDIDKIMGYGQYGTLVRRNKVRYDDSDDDLWRDDDDDNDSENDHEKNEKNKKGNIKTGNSIPSNGKLLNILPKNSSVEPSRGLKKRKRYTKNLPGYRNGQNNTTIIPIFRHNNCTNSHLGTISESNRQKMIEVLRGINETTNIRIGNGERYDDADEENGLFHDDGGFSSSSPLDYSDDSSRLNYSSNKGGHLKGNWNGMGREGHPLCRDINLKHQYYYPIISNQHKISNDHTSLTDLTNGNDCNGIGKAKCDISQPLFLHSPIITTLAQFCFSRNLDITPSSFQQQFEQTIQSMNSITPKHSTKPSSSSSSSLSSLSSLSADTTIFSHTSFSSLDSETIATLLLVENDGEDLSTTCQYLASTPPYSNASLINNITTNTIDSYFKSSSSISIIAFNSLVQKHIEELKRFIIPMIPCCIPFTPDTLTSQIISSLLSNSSSFSLDTISVSLPFSAPKLKLIVQAVLEAHDSEGGEGESLAHDRIWAEDVMYHRPPLSLQSNSSSASSSLPCSIPSVSLYHIQPLHKPAPYVSSSDPNSDLSQTKVSSTDPLNLSQYLHDVSQSVPPDTDRERVQWTLDAVFGECTNIEKNKNSNHPSGFSRHDPNPGSAFDSLFQQKNQHQNQLCDESAESYSQYYESTLQMAIKKIDLATKQITTSVVPPISDLYDVAWLSSEWKAVYKALRERIESKQ